MHRFSLEKDKIKVLLLEGIHENGLDFFHGNGYTNVEVVKKALPEEELVKKIKNTHIIGIRSRTELTKQVLRNAKKLMAIGCYSIGTNQVDKITAKLMGIPVFNAPYSNTRSVAELVIAECIMLMRGIAPKNNAAHVGKWLKSADNSKEVRGKTLGIVGYGHIGTQVSILAEAMGMNVCYFDIEKKLTLGNATPCESLNMVLETADILTLHVPSTPMTKNMIGKKQISKMKKGAYIINASRGDVVDIEALCEALENQHLLGAAADVFPSEPASGDEIFQTELQKYDNVILTPHIGGSTEEAQANIGLEVSEKLVKYSDTGTTIGAVNFVEISLQPNNLKQRFLHIHENVPGVLREINYVFTSRGINIASEYLQTDADIGYVIIDTDSELDKWVLKELKNIKHTIKARMVY
ncbi:MAG: phosphoglycerate dehydrogenase [Bacteroidales bacterium]